MRKQLVFVAFLTAMALSCAFLLPTPAGEVDKVENVPGDDAEMNTAIQRAQETLPLFIRAFQSPKPSQTYFGIKVKFPYGEGNDAEHIWIGDLSFEENRFSGIVGNVPVYVDTIELGDRVTVELDTISDWMIVEDNRLLGGFTLHVLRNRMSAGEREQFDRDTGLIVPDEPELP